MGFYVESADRPFQSRIAAEDIHVGTLVSEDGSDGVQLVDDSDTRIDGLAAAPRSAEYIAPEVDETSDFTYSSSDNDRVPYLPLSDRDIVKVRTITDNSTDPSPSINDGDVVGVAQKGDDAFRGRLVEEGYTDDSPTTYNTGNANFSPLGVAYKDSGTDYDVVVRVDVRTVDHV